MFSLFDMHQVISALIRDTLLGWQGPFVGRKCRKESGPFMHILDYMERKKSKSVRRRGDVRSKA